MLYVIFLSSQFSGSVETHKDSWHNTNMGFCSWFWTKNGSLFPPDTMALGLVSLAMCCSKLLPMYLSFQTWPQGQAMEVWSWCVLQEMEGGCGEKSLPSESGKGVNIHFWCKPGQIKMYCILLSQALKRHKQTIPNFRKFSGFRGKEKQITTNLTWLVLWEWNN